MTPREKAADLVLRHYKKVSGVNMHLVSKMIQFFNTESHFKTAKECALITVSEISAAIDFDWIAVQGLDREHAYWEDVKNEIEKL